MNDNSSLNVELTKWYAFGHRSTRHPMVAPRLPQRTHFSDLPLQRAVLTFFKRPNPAK